MAKCPICFNSISGDTRLRGADGVDSNGDPLPFWTDDPLLTPIGFAGEDYIGLNPIRYVHIKELQVYYAALELSVGTTPTEFIEPFDRDPMVINQLRASVEKILTALGLSIADYFKSDRLGNAVETAQTDWTDVDRTEGEPNLPPNCPIRVCYIEELRRGISSISAIFCSSGGAGNDAPEGYSDSNNGDFKFFKKFKDVSATNPDTGQPYGHTVNNVYEYLHIQEGILYLFSTAMVVGYNTPCISWNSIKNVNTENWQGMWSEWDYDKYKIQFNPELPYVPDVPGLEGISGLSIDDSGSDYLMYTTEFFYNRAVPGTTPADWDRLEYLWRGFPNYIAKYSYPKERELGSSTGEPNQNFYVDSYGIVIPMIENSEKIYVGNSVWTRVEDFSSSGPTDKHYTLDYTTGWLWFGDGIFGMIPSLDSIIKIFITLKMGGIWKFEEIVVDREYNTYYVTPVAKKGKLWYGVNTNAFWAVHPRITYVTSTLTSHHTQNHSGGHLLSETWIYDYQSYTECTADVYMDAELATNIADPVVLDRALGLEVPNTQMPYELGGVQPYVYDDNPSHAHIYFSHKETGLQMRTRSLSANYYLQNTNNNNRSASAQFINYISETVNYGYIDKDGVYQPDPRTILEIRINGNNRWPFSDYSSNPAYNTGSYGSIDALTQMFEQVRTPGSIEWDTYKVMDGEFFMYWERSEGGVYTDWGIPVYKGSRYCDPYECCYYRQEEGSIIRPTSFIPLQIVFNLGGPDGKMYRAFNVEPFSNYTCTYEVFLT